MNREEGGTRAGAPRKYQLKELEQENERLRMYLRILLNGLNCIGRTAYLEGAERAEEGTCCLSHLIQYNVMQEGKPHSIARELANIEQYLSIQKLRMGKYLDWEISVDEETAAHSIPGLSLYPIVEHVLVHGICASPEGGTLRIRSRRRGDELQLVVEGGGSAEAVDIPKEEEKDE